MKEADIFFNIFTALFSAVGLMICLFFLLIAIAIFAWWIYSNFFCEKIEATVVGIRAYKKDTTIEDGVTVKTKPYDMYSPLLLCKLPSGGIANGVLTSSQNWIAERWITGSKINVLQGADRENFNESAGYIPLLISLTFGSVACFFAYSIEINLYTVAMLGIFLLYFLFKLYRRGTLGKFYDFIINRRWKELKRKLPADKNAFLKRKKEEEKNKNWQKLSAEEISRILKRQYKSFFLATVPFLLFFSIGMLLIAYYKFGEKLISRYMDGMPILEIINKKPEDFAIASILAGVGVLIFLLITAKAICLLLKKNSPQPRIF